jgi:hypothetical protein
MRDVHLLSGEQNRRKRVLLRVVSNIFGIVCASLLLQACHVRTPEFHCKLASSPRENMEVAMSPLALRFEDRSFSFVEERGNQRLYRESSSGRLLVFDLSSMQLNEYEAAKKSNDDANDQVQRHAMQTEASRPLALSFHMATPPLKQWACERYKMLSARTTTSLG